MIIELKRPERVLSRNEMLDQSEKYLAGMMKLLQAQDTPHEPVEIVFVLGKEPKEMKNPGGRERVTEQLKSNHARVVYYDGLLQSAEKSYSDYLSQRGVVDKLGQVIAAIDDYALAEPDPETTAAAI